MDNSRDTVLKSPLMVLAYLMGAKFQLGRHHILFNDIAHRIRDGSIKRIIINIPPQHGKTTFWAEGFITWMLSTMPDKKVIYTSYEATRAYRVTNEVRKAIREHPHIFGLRSRKDTDAYFNFYGQRGSVLSAGADGPINGDPADILIIDDPYKSEKEARSPTIRENVWGWWESSARARLSESGVAIVIHTRWNEDDLAGRMLTNEPGRWLHISLPALCDSDDDLLGRELGEALWEEKFSREYLLDIQSTTSPYRFNSIYQQQPASDGNNIIRREWWRSYITMPPANFTVQAWDTAIKDGQENDYSFCASIIRAQGDYYMPRILKERLIFPDLIAAIKREAEIVKPNLILVEDKASGSSAVQQLKRDTRLNIIGVEEEGDKVFRAHLLSPVFMAGRFFTPEGAPWVNGLIENMARFPGVAHDDDMDAIGLGVRWLENRFGSSTSIRQSTHNRANEARERGRTQVRTGRGVSDRISGFRR